VQETATDTRRLAAEPVKATTTHIKRKVLKALDEGGPSLVLRRAVILARTQGVDPLRARVTMSPAEIRDALIVARSRLVGAPVVHAIGDSHTVMLTGVWPFVVHYIAPLTAYNLASPTSSTQSRTRLLEALRSADPRRDIILLTTGGTDCRLHINDQHVRSSGRRSLEELAHETVVRYGTAIDLVRARGFRVAVHSVVGAAHAEEYRYDHSGAIGVRGRIAQLFNAELEAWCRAHGVDYVDLFSHVADEHGILLRPMASDGLHLGRQALPWYGPWLRERVYGRWTAPAPHPRFLSAQGISDWLSSRA
jgi:lysophospholipase L1-like esterase